MFPLTSRIRPASGFVISTTRDQRGSSRASLGKRDPVIQSLLVDEYGMEGMLRESRLPVQPGLGWSPISQDSHPLFPKVLELADCPVLSLRFAQKITGESEPANCVLKLWSERRHVVVITCGQEGCCWMSQQQMQPKHQRGFPVKVQSTLGCGDVFHGALAAMIEQDRPLEEGIVIATATAAVHARIVRSPGTRSASSTRLPEPGVIGYHKRSRTLSDSTSAGVLDHLRFLFFYLTSKIWRRGWDSNPRGFAPIRFRGGAVMTASVPLHSY